MADSDRILKILLQLQADVAGAKEAKTAIQDVAATTGSVADQLKAAGATFDPVTRTFKSIADESKVIPGIWDQTGISIARARNEAVTLVRELATGAPVARTIGAIVGSLGTQLGVAGIAAFLVIKAISGWRDAIINTALEQAKLADEINRSEVALQNMASLATSFSDVLRVEQAVVSEVQKLGTEIDKAAAPLKTYQLIWEKINTAFAGATLSASLYHPSADQSKEVQRLNQELANTIIQEIAVAHYAEQMQKGFASIATLSWPDQFNKLKDNIAAAAGQQKTLEESIKQTSDAIAKETDPQKSTALKASLQALTTEWHHQGEIIGENQTALAKFGAEAESVTEQGRRLADQFEKAKIQSLDPQEKVKALQSDLEKANKDLEVMGFDSVQAALGVLALGAASGKSTEELKALVPVLERIISLQVQLGAAEKQEAKGDASAARKDLLADLRQQENLIQSIRQQQQLISNAPFLSADEKANQSLRSMVSEVQALQTYLDKLNADKLKALDPAQLELVNGKIQQTRFQIGLLRESISALQQPLLASLNSWAQSFGTTTQQISHAIQGSINAGLAQLNSLLLTGKFNAGQLLQTVGQIGLQLIEQLIIQRVMAAVNHAAAIGQAAVTGPAIATAMAPAATMATIASFGSAAIEAPIAVAASLAAIQGMAFAESGGIVGASGPQLTMTGERGPEFVFSAPAVRNIGRENLDAAHKSALGMSSGGGGGSSRASSGKQNLSFAFLTDRSALRRWLMSGENAQKIVVDPISGKVIQVS